MNNTWRGSYAAKALTVVLTTVFLWGTGLALMSVLIEAANGFVSDPAEVNAAFVNRIANNSYSELDDYIRTALYEKYGADSTLRSENVIYADSEYYSAHFDPAGTNLRFHAADSSGAVIVSNDGGSISGEILGKKTFSQQYTTSVKRYEVHNVFSDVNELRRADMTSYLDNSADYQLWYFTDSDVQNAHDYGVEIEYADGKYTDVLYFENEASAEAYGYWEQYGDQATWEIVPNTDGDSEMSCKAIVTAYRESGTETVSIADYYSRRESGEDVKAVDPVLEQKLTGGIEVTIVGNQSVSETVTATVWLPADLPVSDSIRSNYEIFSLLRGKAEIISAALFFFAIAAIISGIAMCSAAGHAEGTDAIVIPSVHKLPYGLFWALPVAAFFGGVCLFESIMEVSGSGRVQMIFAGGTVLGIAISCVLWLYTTAVRVKSNTFWSSFGIVRVLRASLGLLHHKTATCVLTAAGFTGLCLMNGIAAISEQPALILPIIGLDLLALILILYCIYSYFTLHQHMRQITLGHFEPERYVLPLAGDFLTFDGELNTLTVRVGEMVAQQMRAEHLRTELITNVSHDLKTPLTSIVNYVDLLSREPQQSEEAQEYLEVLSRQAARLKKLTTDLVEASKASTGNVKVEMQTTNVQVLLSQFAGEYDDKLQQSNLELVLSMPEQPFFILADGRLMMRVFDNLMNNACKYAMPGTRVYLDAASDGQNALITMKNVSAAPLNVSAEELMERFVRGDSSRHTEGSGLGLSIARDLTALQGGMLSLHTDGDLFKAVLTFPLYQPPMLEDQEIM